MTARKVIISLATEETVKQLKLKQEIKLGGKMSKAKSWRDNNEMRDNTSVMLMVKHSILSTVG